MSKTYVMIQKTRHSMIEMIPVKSEQNQTKLAYLDGQLDTVGKIYVVCTL